MAKLLLLLTGDDINERIPYAFICVTTGGSRWNTGKRRRAYAEEFTEGEHRKCRELYKVSCNMFIRHGVPTEMSRLKEV